MVQDGTQAFATGLQQGADSTLLNTGKEGAATMAGVVKEAALSSAGVVSGNVQANVQGHAKVGRLVGR